MTDAGGAGGTCYRHPDRQSYILCQRCGRTICPECQTPAPVGFQCPECMRESRASAPRTKPAIVTTLRRAGRNGGPVVTYSLIGLNLVAFIAQQIPGLGEFMNIYLVYRPVLTELLPWSMLTSAFLHGSFLHILFNMFSLLIFGRILEPLLGRGRFIALYLLSALGGSVAVLLLNPTGGVLGASGAVFGLMGALLVIQRGLGGNANSLLVLIGLNLVAGFLIPNVSWQAHLGGVIVGAAIGLIYVRNRTQRKQTTGALLTAAVGVALALVTVAGVLTGSRI